MVRAWRWLMAHNTVATFTKIKLQIGGSALVLQGSFTLADVTAVIDRWFGGLTTGATVEEQAALASRLNAYADRLHAVNAQLAALGKK